MRLLFHMRTILWKQTSSSILQFSFTCGVAARSYSWFSPKIVQHARSRLGSLLIGVIPDPPVFSPQFLQPGPVVYLIFSLWHHHRYIGSTSDLSRRMRDHLSCCVLTGQAYSIQENSTSSPSYAVVYPRLFLYISTVYHKERRAGAH